MFSRFIKSQTYAIILNILMPGLGHLFWKETLFGVFVFLVTLIASFLFFVSFFINLSLWVKIILFGIPVVFYFFTFVDIHKTIKVKKKNFTRNSRALLIFFVIGLVYQFVVPVAFGNYYLRNFPEVYIHQNNELSPIFESKTILKTEPTSYTVNLFFMDKPFLHALPNRYDIVRFLDSSDFKHTGIVVGLPDEDIEIIDGVVIVNGLPDYDGLSQNWTLQGETELTRGDIYSILIITLKFGAVDRVYSVPLEDIKGKVTNLF
ncbi:MAG: hypothetical protein DRP35_02465 [Candidatus Zixiibacteriota bacterium]|nr:MAG: hypothetical protein DRP35_02465 [candidate division Zixibacteria bacterium]